MNKYTIVGVTFSGNKGAAGMLESTIQNITDRLPDAQFSVLSIAPEADQRLNRYPNVTIYNSKPLYLACIIVPAAFIYRFLPSQSIRRFIEKAVPEVREIRSSKAILDEGGITFSDGREIFLLFNIATIVPGLLLKIKVIKVAQALGPFHNPINSIAARFFLPYMHLIIARGDITMQYLKNLGLTNITQGVDIAFALSQKKIDKQKIKQYTPKPSTRVIGISPSVIIYNKMKKDGKDYILLLSRVIDECIDSNYEVIIIPHSVRLHTDKQHNNDLPLSRMLYRSFQDNSAVKLVNDELSPQELRSIIGTCDIFISSRFHAMVSSLKMAVPTLVLGWSHKYKEVLSLFELEEYALPYQQISAQNMVQYIQTIEQNKKAIRIQIEKHLPSVIAQAEDSFRLIVQETSERPT